MGLNKGLIGNSGDENIVNTRFGILRTTIALKNLSDTYNKLSKITSDILRLVRLRMGGDFTCQPSGTRGSHPIRFTLR